MQTGRRVPWEASSRPSPASHLMTDTHTSAFWPAGPPTWHWPDRPLFCDACLLEARMGKIASTNVATATQTTNTREGLRDVPLCDAHVGREGVGPAERL